MGIRRSTLSRPYPYLSITLYTHACRSEREETYVRPPADVLTQAGLNTVNVDVEEDAGGWVGGGGAVPGKGGIA